MATTKIWKIQKRLDHVIDYTTNPEKTSKESYNELHNVIEYAKASYKTEEQLYVTALNCEKDSVYEDMMRTKRRYSKTDGILGYHAFQSFAKDEITPEVAHKVGVELAQELWGDRFEVIVTTHLNTNHIHNHFCLNSVSFKDGKKYYDNHANYALMRETSDRICEENNLSVLKEKKCPKSKIDYSNFYKKQSNYNMSVKEDIDYAIEQSYSYNDFLNIMKKMGYEINNRAGKLSVRKESHKRNIRIERAFGEEYSISSIQKKIFETESIRLPFPEVRTLNKKYKSKKNVKIRNNKKLSGIRALYFHYCYLLKVYPKRKQKMSKSMREEVKKLENYTKEVTLLNKLEIQTEDELETYKSTDTIKLKELKSKREYLWKKYNRSTDDNTKQEIYEEIITITKEIEKTRKEKELLEDIKSRIPKMKADLTELEKNNETGKEKESNEYIK